MIRFLNLKGQIYEGVASFAFFYMPTGVLVRMDCQVIWHSWKEFEEVFRTHTPVYVTDLEGGLKHFYSLIPPGYFAGAKDGPVVEWEQRS